MKGAEGKLLKLLIIVFKSSGSLSLRWFCRNLWDQKLGIKIKIIAFCGEVCFCVRVCVCRMSVCAGLHRQVYFLLRSVDRRASRQRAGFWVQIHLTYGVNLSTWFSLSGLQVLWNGLAVLTRSTFLSSGGIKLGDSYEGFRNEIVSLLLLERGFLGEAFWGKDGD